MPQPSTRQPKPRRAPRRRRGRGRRGDPVQWSWQVLEAAALGCAALVGVIAVLGRAAASVAGTGLWANLLPFAGIVLLLGVAIAAALWGWLALRAPLARWAAWAPALVAAALATIAGWLGGGPQFQSDVGDLRALLGGRPEAERRAITHQVFAAYRRTPVEAWQRLLARGLRYEADIAAAAAAFGVDAEVLTGLAAAESGFSPRTSHDGGRGLFQVTAPPAAALAAARAALGVEAVDLQQPRQNAFVAAAVLREYLEQMNGDLFLGLLAYNIGPANGGLRSIMQQYGARDFVTIQPYLQNLPRDYPVRVLAAALAYRLSRSGEKLPRYEEGDNAARIQRIGVPGL